MANPTSIGRVGLLEFADQARLAALPTLRPRSKRARGQVFTKSTTARFMISLLRAPRKSSVRVVDPGAGVGSLTAAYVASLCELKRRPEKVEITVYEVDSALIPKLTSTLRRCKREANAAGIELTYAVRNEDFVTACSRIIRMGSGAQLENFDIAILNPPYRKLGENSRARRSLRSCGLDAPNLYAAFLLLALKVVCARGQIVSITPRSFCNGPHFDAFRQLLVSSSSIDRIHLFESRRKVFSDDGVLQETLALAITPGKDQGPVIAVSTGDLDKQGNARPRLVPSHQVVRREGGRLVISIPGPLDDYYQEAMNRLSSTLVDLGIQVSTGPVVDFRNSAALRTSRSTQAARLIVQHHVRSTGVVWPLGVRDCKEAIQVTRRTLRHLRPDGYYVLVRRFSSKEQRKRLIAAVQGPTGHPSGMIGFENHLNYFHADGRPLSCGVAKGLAVYLNSDFVDKYVRLASGHTQVNATDLRGLRYPSLKELADLGSGHLHLSALASLEGPRVASDSASLRDDCSGLRSHLRLVG